MIVAVVAHAAVLTGLAVSIAPDGAGTGGTVLEAIGVSIVDSSVLASHDERTSQPASAAAVASIAATMGANEPEQSSVAAQTATVAATSDADAPTVLTAREARARDDAVATGKAASASLNADPKPIEPIRHTSETVAATTTVLAAPAFATGSTSAHVTSPVAREPQAGSAAAGPGEMAAYARDLATALAKSSPRAMAGLRGRITVRFLVGADGHIGDVAVAETSGNARLDRTAIDSVERARVPAPPTGMTDKQRTYVLPFVFR